MAGTAVTSRRYKNPPVLEALCEIYFAGTRWNPTIPGLFYSEIKDTYPGIESKKTVVLEEAPTREPFRVRFATAVKDRLVQVGPDVLVVNQLRPYTQYPEWKGVVLDMLDRYHRLVQPDAIARIGVRYLNRICVPAKPAVNMEEYFQLYPQLPSNLKAHGAFLLRMVLPPRFQNHELLVTFGSAQEETPGVAAFLLDIHDRATVGGKLEQDQIADEIERIHDQVYAVFESSITQRLRDEVFEEIKS